MQKMNTVTTITAMEATHDSPVEPEAKEHFEAKRRIVQSLVPNGPAARRGRGPVVGRKLGAFKRFSMCFVGFLGFDRAKYVIQLLWFLFFLGTLGDVLVI